MLHVWTLWTRPWLGEVPPLDLGALELSIRLVAARGHPCRLYCDHAGARAVAARPLPAQVFPVLDQPMEAMAPGKWAAAKIHTYSLQDQPFVHVDHDCFLLEEPLPPPAGSALSVQHLENLPENELFYRRLASDFLADARQLPADVAAALGQQRPWGYNMGYFAVHNPAGMEFLAAYTSAAWGAFQLMRRTTRRNCAFAEQLMLQAMTWARHVPVHCLFSTAVARRLREEQPRIGYVHFMGRKEYQREACAQWICQRLAQL
jgi:hypothetical protein